MSGDYVYCVGGTAVYYATLGGTGLSGWSATTDYPTDISGESCVASAGYLYCISGIDGMRGPRPTDAVYYAQLSPAGGIAGGWRKTTSYPQGAISLSCAASAGYVYCVGGENTLGTLQNDSVYYAPVSSSGIGTWAATTPYPITVDGSSCVTSGAFIYCFAGFTANGPGSVDSTYYAQISSSGVGGWTPGPSYPADDYGLSCVAASGYAYCIGGVTGPGNATSAVYYASLSSQGIGAWRSTTSYPTPIIAASCVEASDTIACIAGYTAAGVENATDAVYYTPAET